MINTIKKYLSNIIKRLELSKINFLNHKFRKFIIKYEIKNNKIKIYNSNGDYKIVDNTIPNKVKIMEIIKEHEQEIDKEIKYYNKNKEDYKIILISSSLFLIVLGFLFIFSFFVGNYILFILTLLSFIISLVLFIINTYKTLLFREEVKRLIRIKDNTIVLNDNELLDIFKDLFIYIKKYYYELITKIFKLFDNIKVKLSKI